MAALELDRGGEVLIEFDPAGQPFELAVAQEARAVEPELLERGQFGEGAVLDGGDGVVVQVEHPETLHARERFLGNRLDPVGRETEFRDLAKLGKCSVRVFDRPRDLVVIQLPKQK